MKPTTIGLIGSIGAGKSTVARLFAERGALVLDADAMSHRLLDEPTTKAEIMRRWGTNDRKALGKIVFADDRELKALEAILHPQIRFAIVNEIARSNAKVIVIDAPLLLEVGWRDLVDRLIVVDAPLNVRQARVFKRNGWSAEELAKREKVQMPIAEKRRLADVVIENSTDDVTFDHLYNQIEFLWPK